MKKTKKFGELSIDDNIVMVYPGKSSLLIMSVTGREEPLFADYDLLVLESPESGKRMRMSVPKCADYFRSSLGVSIWSDLTEGLKEFLSRCCDITQQLRAVEVLVYGKNVQ